MESEPFKFIMGTLNLNNQLYEHYYISMTTSGLLFMIPQSIANSLIAEGSYKENDLMA